MAESNNLIIEAHEFTPTGALSSHPSPIGHTLPGTTPIPGPLSSKPTPVGISYDVAVPLIEQLLEGYMVYFPNVTKYDADFRTNILSELKKDFPVGDTNLIGNIHKDINVQYGQALGNFIVG